MLFETLNTGNIYLLCNRITYTFQYLKISKYKKNTPNLNFLTMSDIIQGI